VRHPLAAWLPAGKISLFMIWYGGIPVVAGMLLIAFEVVVLVASKTGAPPRFRSTSSGNAA